MAHLIQKLLSSRSQGAARHFFNMNAYNKCSLHQGVPLGAAHVDEELIKIGPWPRTKEERERAARKYNLIPEDYQPFDEFEARGDYPNLPAVGDFNRDPYEDFDEPEFLRNYGEVHHVDYDLYLYHRIDPHAHSRPDNPVWFKIGVVWFMGLIPFTALWIDKKFKLHINQPFKHREAIQDQQLYEFPPGTGLPSHH